jgi:hypothetical protein
MQFLVYFNLLFLSEENDALLAQELQQQYLEELEKEREQQSLRDLVIF